MILQINPQYRIVENAYQFTLERSWINQKTQEMIWKPLGYYKELGPILRYLLNEKIKFLDTVTMKELLSRLEEIEALIEEETSQVKDLWGERAS